MEAPSAPIFTPFNGEGDDQTFGGTNGAFWSIGVEAQLYLIYPLLLALAARWGWPRAAWLTAVIEMALRVIACVYLFRRGTGELNADVPKLLIGNPFFYWFSWSVGAYLAEAYVRGRALPFSGVSIPGLVLVTLGVEMVKPLPNFGFPLFALLTVTVISRMLGSEFALAGNSGFLSGQMARIGLWSYSIYLLHQPIMFWAASLLRGYSPPALNRHLIVFCLMLATGAIIMPLSGLWYRWCELPAIALGKRFTSRLVRVRDGQRHEREASV